MRAQVLPVLQRALSPSAPSQTQLRLLGVLIDVVRGEESARAAQVHAGGAAADAKPEARLPHPFLARRCARGVC